MRPNHQVAQDSYEYELMKLREQERQAYEGQVRDASTCACDRLDDVSSRRVEGECGG